MNALRPFMAIFGVFKMLHHFDHLALFYDKLLGRPKLSVLRSLLRLPISGLLLDVGGGTARVSYPLRQHVRQAVIADISLPMLEQAKRKGPMWTVKSDAKYLPFPDGTFERVLIVDAFHHFADQERSLAEMARIMKTGARMVIEEPDVRRWGVKVAALAEKLLLMKSHFLAPASIVEIMGRHGLSARVAESDLFRVWIIADKHASGIAGSCLLSGP